MKRVISIALIMAFAVLMLSGCKPFGEQGSNPYEYREDASPEPVTNEPTAEPIPYNRKEYDALLAFFELADENGVKNGEKCFTGYDPKKADFWGAKREEYQSWLQWDESGNLLTIELYGVAAQQTALVGEFKLHGFDSLENIAVQGLSFESVNVKDCLKLYSVSAISCTKESRLIGEHIARFDISSTIHCYYENTGSDVVKGFDFIADLKIEGSGSVGITGIDGEPKPYEVAVYATAAEGHKFIGWYDAEGNLISSEAHIEISYFDTTQEGLIAGVNDFIGIAKFE